MRRLVIALLALLLAAGIAIPSAGAAESTAEQKFEFLKQKGIFAGFADGSARLDQSMTREQFAQVLYKLMELPPPTGAASFTDVLRARWSYPAVEAVAKAGLMVGVGPRKFGPDSQVTVEQLAAILVRLQGWSQEGPVYVNGRVSGWARVSVGIAVQNGLIPRMNDYTVSASRRLLVEAVYAVYIQMHPQEQEMRVRSVSVVSNQQLRVHLNQPVIAADKSRFRIRDARGAEVLIRATVTDQDGLAVTIITDRHAGGQVYTLYADNVPWTYYVEPEDTVKPQVESFSRQGSKLEITFTEPVEHASATNRSNYSLNNGLRVTDVRLSGDRKVALTITSPKDGETYRLIVRNVKDLAGNVMQEWRTEFKADDSAPKASFFFNESTAQIVVSFNERVHPGAAADRNRYSIDKGLTVTRAELDEDGKTVYLTTSPQKDATIYTLTVSGIPDLAGNVMQTQQFFFGGVAHPVQPLRLQNVKAVNQNTIEIAFDRPLSDADVSKLGAAILTDNGKSVSMAGWQAFKMRASGDNKAVTVQFRVDAHPNPDLFRPGHVYLLRVTGIDHLVVADGANEAHFAGTEAPNPVPFVKEAVPLSRNAVKVVFSEPVRNVSEAAFLVREKGGEAVKIEDDELNNPGAIVTEVVVRFEANLEPGHVYVMTFRPAVITDAAGWNGLLTKNGKEDYAVEFRGI